MQMSVTRGRCRSGLVRLILNLALLAIVVGTSLDAQAQTYTPFSVFSQMTTTELATCQVKLTFGVRYDSPLPTYLLATSTPAADLHAFYPFHRAGFPYISDFIEVAARWTGGFVSPQVAVVTATELQAAIAAVAPLSGVVDGGVDSSAELSFALLQKSGGTTRCFETQLNGTNATLLLSALKQVLVVNAPAYNAVVELACAKRWLSATNATLVSTSAVKVTMTGLQRNQSAGDCRFSGSVTVKNVSHKTLSPPLFLVLGCKDFLVSLVGATGLTCKIKPSGAPYIVLPVGSGMVRNASVTVPLEFDNPMMKEIELDYVAPNNQAIYPRVFQGAGER